MLDILVGVLLILHGLVHLLYIGQSQILFELSSGMVWPDESWVFSKRLGERGIRILASTGLLMAAFGFVAGGITYLARSDWWVPLVGSTAIFSSLVTLLFWDGSKRRLADQGFVGMLINFVILGALVVFQ